MIISSFEVIGVVGVCVFLTETGVDVFWMLVVMVRRYILNFGARVRRV